MEACGLLAEFIWKIKFVDFFFPQTSLLKSAWNSCKDNYQ